MIDQYLSYLQEKTLGWKIRVENPDQDRLLIMCHGWRSGPDGLDYFNRFFMGEGYSIFRLNISQVFGSVKTIYQELGHQLSMIENIGQYKVIDFLGFSMGGIIMKAMLDEHVFPNGRRCVFLGTPFDISGISISSRMLLANVIKLARHIKAQKIKSRQIKVGLIGGDDPNRKSHLDEPHDGFISLKSVFDTKDNVVDKKVVPVNHFKLKKDPNIARLMLKFYNTGRF